MKKYIYYIKDENGFYVKRTPNYYIPNKFDNHYILSNKKMYATKWKTKESAMDFIKNNKINGYTLESEECL